METERYRKELQVHCYRMLGSTFEAEDAVQETMLRAWRASGRFEGRTTVRNWLYRIATNVCLDALARRKAPRRLVPERSGPPSALLPAGPPLGELEWLEPYPDSALEGIPDADPDPPARYEAREATQLAFVAAIQYLPPRQRAVLLLRDVIGCSAAETANALEMSVASANSALQRARETLKKNLPSRESIASSALAEGTQRLLLDRYVHAWERADLDELVGLLKEDAVFSMPPRREWYRGRAKILELLQWALPASGCEAFYLVPTGANGQPAFAVYGRDEGSSELHAHALHVLTLEENQILVLSNFMNTAIFSAFHLPLVLPSEADLSLHR
ncbi:MAG: sigma-70 family RNA polymerase sigma factor [Vulcanimicrobiaceae bacterium]